jgi:serine/threonine-protein kinase
VSFEIGQTVGGYEFIDVLERSKAGVTYKVRNTLLQRFEALKVLPTSWHDDQERVERFLREMKVHARLLHPNIVAFYSAAQLEGQMVMTTELVEGLTLQQMLEGVPLAVADAARYMGQALSALEYAHQQGVVHRGITPSHILITPGGTVKLTGFELAKAVNGLQLTQVGTVMGSLQYISPEQVKGAPDIDGRADLYSLGVVFYQAVTGRLPFESTSQFDLMLAHVNKPPQPPGDVRPDLPPQLNEVILRALAKEPLDRYQTAQEFREALERVQPPAPAPSGPLKVAETPTPPRPALPPLTPPLAGLPAGAAIWTSPQLLAAGIFVFLMMAFAFYAVLTAGRG